MVYSAGYKSRYRHPHPRVMARYERLNVRAHHTAEAGAVQFLIKQGSVRKIVYAREQKHRYWL